MTERQRRQSNSAKPHSIEADYPHVAEWVKGCGWIEVGEQDWHGFVARALDDGGLVFESEDCRTLAEAFAALEKGLGEWFEQNR